MRVWIEDIVDDDRAAVALVEDGVQGCGNGVARDMFAEGRSASVRVRMTTRLLMYSARFAAVSWMRWIGAVPLT
ncbi:hypothetical protein [Agrobacterium vitis]|uniref:hypothetical protein n=1 Tax=Agrobacterium vitis TaxID=373 RepID=UPI001F37D59E|nr:hypothetical protein [Agrobacterium vitis]